MHALLRPPERRSRARVRQGLPDRLDPVRRALRTARARAGPARATQAGRPIQGSALPGRRWRWRRGRGCLLSAARRPRGLRATPRPARSPPPPGLDLGRHRRRGRHARGGVGGCRVRGAQVSVDGASAQDGGAASAQKGPPAPIWQGRPVRSYHGQPVLKQPVWTWEIPCYLFTGGLGGSSAALAQLADLRGNEVLGRRAWTTAAVAGAISPLLLISDLGRPM